MLKKIRPSFLCPEVGTCSIDDVTEVSRDLFEGKVSSIVLRQIRDFEGFFGKKGLKVIIHDGKYVTIKE